MKIGTARIAQVPPPRQSSSSAASAIVDRFHPSTQFPDGTPDRQVWCRPKISYGEITASSRLFEWTPPTYLARGLECAQITGEVAQTYATGPLKTGLTVFNGAVAAGTLYSGIHDLAHAETNLDRIGGIASIALATDVGLSCLQPHPSAALTNTSHALGLVYGTADIILGCYDFKRGLKEKDGNYAAAGLFEAAMGASQLAAIAIPRFGPIGDALMLVSLVGRHFCFEKELFKRRQLAQLRQAAEG